jgi:hypothetical protein
LEFVSAKVKPVWIGPLMWRLFLLFFVRWTIHDGKRTFRRSSIMNTKSSFIAKDSFA